ncbi:hypothetical protein AB6A40_009793 [Gnathostoma spinigerum]|uniref:Uncharacterized protein n=1 Tax=Gnathostoma spinigerum TaxID=75299 RepID=A0ABD6ESY6_9BILA
MEELAEFQEVYGIPRIRQVLESAEWCGKVLKQNPLETHENRERLKKLLSNDDENDQPSYDDYGFINEMFRGPCCALSDVSKCDSDVDEDVLAYFRKELQNLSSHGAKIQPVTNRKKKKKKKSQPSKSAVDEFGDYVGTSKQVDTTVVTDESTSMSNITGENRSDAIQDPLPNDATKLPSYSEVTADLMKTGIKESMGTERLYESDNDEKNRAMTKELIDDICKQDEDCTQMDVGDVAKKLEKVRLVLSKMPFGEDRQNFAADTMVEMIKTIGAEDLLISNSEDES